MRKMLAISLISLHLFGNTELAQLLNLPELIRHYLQHQHQNHSLGFLSFLFQHYCGDDGTKADDNEDAQLPFHNFHHACLTINNIAPLLLDQEFEHPSFQDPRDYSNQLKENLSFMQLEVVLQPPRTNA